MIMWSRCSDRAEQSRSSMRVAGGGTAHSIPPLTTGRLHNPKEAHICGGMGVPGPYSETRSQQEGPAAPIRRLGYVVGKGLGCVEGSLPVRPPCISHLQHQQLPPVCAKKAPWGPGCQAEGIGEPQDIDTFVWEMMPFGIFLYCCCLGNIPAGMLYLFSLGSRIV
ncbi:uncharacterized protein LOC128343388 isoform X2 [Hemicordylus capensis]|uniref:uncharacterized protein LOC128343388 isoform X2 n=1 Tax=Hemicordylus capensis TaxID=884348 RepID=UPI00230236B7|nr:uncharacterized protein LOC128343388 isoform X2 [Hemicordylus capensis]